MKERGSCVESSTQLPLLEISGYSPLKPAGITVERSVCPFFDMICRKLDSQRSPNLLIREYSVVRGICKSAAALSMFPFASCKACRIKPRS